MAFAVERLIAFRYLRARRKEGFVSVIAGFSLVGIALGVATLIIVMAVMNGFRHDILDRMLGLNGHINIYPGREQMITDWEPMTAKIKAVPGVVSVMPTIEGQVLAVSNSYSAGALVRAMRYEDLNTIGRIADHI